MLRYKEHCKNNPERKEKQCGPQTDVTEVTVSNPKLLQTVHYNSFRKKKLSFLLLNDFADKSIKKPQAIFTLFLDVLGL
jgi:hypothetical protein